MQTADVQFWAMHRSFKSDLLFDNNETITHFRWSVTWYSYLDDVGIISVLVRLAVLGVLEKYSAHVWAGVLEQLVGVVEDNERDLAITQHAQLVRLLHQTELSLSERHLSPTNRKSLQETRLLLWDSSRYDKVSDSDRSIKTKFTIYAQKFKEPEAQLSQRCCAMLRVVQNFAVT